MMPYTSKNVKASKAFKYSAFSSLCGVFAGLIDLLCFFKLTTHPLLGMFLIFILPFGISVFIYSTIINKEKKEKEICNEKNNDKLN